MYRILRACLRILTAISLPFLYAASVRAATLSWDNCVSQAQQNNADLHAALLTYSSTHDLEGTARSGFFPQLNGELDYNKGPGNASTPGIYTAKLNASQNLFSGFLDQGKLSQAKANSRVASSTLQITKARISFDLKSAYAGLLFAKEFVTQTADTIKRREENLKLVQLRFQGGLENKGSFLLSQASLAQARFDNLQARNALRLASAQLARAIGRDTTTDLDIAGDVPTHDPPAQPVPLTDLAAATPDYVQSVAQEESNTAAVRVARAPFFPTLDLTGSAGNAERNFFPQEGGTWTVGVALKLPILNGGKDYSNTRSASDARAASEAARINVSRQTLAKLEQAYDAFVEGVAAFDVAKLYREAALLRAEIARKRYNNGLLSFEDWDGIENDLINRQRKYLETRRDRVVTEAGWEQALGKGVIP